MIIKKSRFKFNKAMRNAWPFTVPEIAAIIKTIDNEAGKPMICVAIVHDFEVYAISQILIDNGLPSIANSDIWRKPPGAVNGSVGNVDLNPFIAEVIKIARTRMVEQGAEQTPNQEVKKDEI